MFVVTQNEFIDIKVELGVFRILENLALVDPKCYICKVGKYWPITNEYVLSPNAFRIACENNDNFT